MGKCLDCDNEALSDGSYRCAYHNTLRAQKEAAEAQTEFIREQKFRQYQEDRKQRDRELAEYQRQAFIEKVKEKAALTEKGYERLEELRLYAKERGLTPVYFFRYASVEHDILTENIPDVEPRIQKVMDLIHRQLDTVIKKMAHDERALAFRDFGIDESVGTTIGQMTKSIEANREQNSKLTFYSTFQIKSQWFCITRDAVDDLMSSSGYEGKRIEITQFNNVFFLKDLSELATMLQKLEVEAHDTMSFVQLVASVSEEFQLETQKTPTGPVPLEGGFKKGFIWGASIVSILVTLPYIGLLIYKPSAEPENWVGFWLLGIVILGSASGLVIGVIVEIVIAVLNGIEERKLTYEVDKAKKYNQANSKKVLALLDELYQKMKNQKKPTKGYIAENY